MLDRLVCTRGARAIADSGGTRTALAARLSTELERGRGLLVRRLLLDPVRALLSRRPGRGGRLGGIPVVRGGQGDPHGRIRRAGRSPDGAVVGCTLGGGPVGGGGSDPRPARLRVAGTRERRHRYEYPDASRAIHRRVRAFLHVRLDCGIAGAGPHAPPASLSALARPRPASFPRAR